MIIIRYESSLKILFAKKNVWIRLVKGWYAMTPKIQLWIHQCITIHDLWISDVYNIFILKTKENIWCHMICLIIQLELELEWVLVIFYGRASKNSPYRIPGMNKILFGTKENQLETEVQFTDSHLYIPL